jgi:hypothetical protein
MYIFKLNLLVVPGVLLAFDSETTNVYEYESIPPSFCHWVLQDASVHVDDHGGRPRCPNILSMNPLVKLDIKVADSILNSLSIVQCSYS